MSLGMTVADLREHINARKTFLIRPEVSIMFPNVNIDVLLVHCDLELALLADKSAQSTINDLINKNEG